MGGSVIPVNDTSGVEENGDEKLEDNELEKEKYSVETFLRSMLHPLYRYIIVGQDHAIMTARPLLA